MQVYSSLHNHTHFSLLDGYATPKEYFERAKEIGINAFAVTEHGNAYSWVYFDKLKKDYPEIKMIYGVELYECFDMSVHDSSSKHFHLIALAKNENGRIALNEIITQSNFEGFYYKPRVDLKALAPYAKDLIVTSACLASKLSREADYEQCKVYVQEYKEIFPHFYLEMQSHSGEEQASFNRKILRLSQDTNTPYIITTDSHAAGKEDLYYQARHVQIAHDSETMSESYEGCYLQSGDEIHSIMDAQIGRDNVDIGLEMTNEISDLIENVSMPFQQPKLPSFPLPDGFNSNAEYLEHLVEVGWKKRGCGQLSSDEQKIRVERKNYELEIICKMGYEGYFLIVWDFINFARNNDIMVGAGRGSCSGSLICYLLGITDLDPIKYGLIFERFLNPERISMPDTDTDVSDRGKIIEYLISKYGAERVCQVLNYSYITPVVAIKDVGRVLDIPYAVCDKISKKFTADTFAECLENNPTILEDYPQYAELFDIASKLSGRLRQVSIHAGGVGIVDTKITDFMPMKLGSDGEHIIQVDKRYIEEIGIIKFDILGVVTLNLVKEVIDDLGLNEFEININNPRFEQDAESYELLQNARTNGVFQVESSGMKDLLYRLKPLNMDELCAVISLFRPDTMPMLESFISNKYSPESITYLHEDMKPILETTYGCLVYQEQLLDIVRKFGGRTYGGADLFRKGIGKKDKALVRQEASKLYQEIIDNWYDEHVAHTISGELSEMGGYSFNKSHGMSYAVLCKQTAYLKTYYPLHFFKGLLNQNKNNAGMINKYIVDANSFGIEVLPPNVNLSGINFTVNDGKILFGLSAIRGIGEKFASVILEELKKESFRNFEDFVERTNPSKSQIIILIKAGAIPCKNKKDMLVKYLKSLFPAKDYKEVSTLPTLKDLKETWHIDAAGLTKAERIWQYNERRKMKFIAEQELKYSAYIDECKEKFLSDEEFWEFEALSVFINNNPFAPIYDYLTPLHDTETGAKCIIVGIIANVAKKKDKNKKQFAFLNIYSADGLIEAVCWHTQLKENEELIKKGTQVAVLCKKENNEKVIIEQIKPYKKWLAERKTRK